MSVFPLWLPPNRAANDFRRRRRLRFPRVLCVVTHHPRFLTAGQQVATTAAAVVNVVNAKSRIFSYMHNNINSFVRLTQVITTIFTVSERLSVLL